MKKTMLVAALISFAAISVNAADYFKKFSFETLGTIKHSGENFKEVNYGAGVAVGYTFNKYVTMYGRGLTYKNEDNWRGGAIDEGSLLFESNILQTKDGAAALGIIGGVDRDFHRDDWGLSVGVCPSFKLSKNVSIFVESRFGLEEKAGKSIRTTGGLNWSW